MMKYLFLSVLALSLSGAWAQKLMVKPPKKLPVARSYTPPNTYRLSEKSEIVYAQTDNMPILLMQSPENMPNVPLKMGRDSGGVYKMPNPLRREAKPLPKKP
jgi:hypothetical protein